MTPSNEPEVSKAGAFSYHTVLAALRCWWKIVVPISIVCAGVAASAVLLLHKPMYTSEAWLMIDPKRPTLLTETRAESQKFIQNQIQIIRSRRLLEPLLANPAIVATPELRREQIELTIALAKKLSVKPVGQSDMYAVSFTSESADKAALIVKEVVKAYIEHHTIEEGMQGDLLVESLKKQGDARYREMVQLREQVKTKAMLLTGVDPFRPQSKAAEQEQANGQNPFAGLQKEIIDLQIKQDILSATIKAEEHERIENDYAPSDKEIEKQLDVQPSYQEQKVAVQMLEEKESEFLRTGKNLETNPAFKQLRATLAKERGKLETLKQDLEGEVKEFLVKQAGAEADAKIGQLKEEFRLGAIRLQVLNEKFKEGMTQAKQVTGDTLDLEFLRAKLQQVTEVHDAIHKRILAITTEAGAPKRVDVYQEASEPKQPDEIYPWKKMGMAGGLLFFAPLALCVAWEHFFRRISSRSQVENMPHLNVVGEVTSLPSRSGRSSSRSAQRDVLLFEESVDSLRTCLRLSERGRELRVIAVASAVSGEGKTSLASQLAVSIARATREPTLIIDGDLRSPDVHSVFEVDAGPGLAEVLQKDCPLEEAIETGFSDRLHILTAGKLRTSPHRLLGTGEFEAMLDKLKGTYRHIIIDTPPILPASESLVFARAADTAILCIRRDYSRIDQSQAAFNRMTAAGVDVAGAVLNGIPTREYAYHYGDYNYERALMA